VTRYDPETREGGLFAGYIDTFLKLKAEASGYTAWVRTSADEELYIESFWKSEGIQLDKEAIKPNATKLGLAKLCLNSIWGKLTERNDRTRTKIITEPHEMYRFLATPGVEVTNLVFASDDVAWLSWKATAEENVPYLPHKNEEIGAYVTAGARIHLYSFLDRLQENAINCDTDPVIFIQPSGKPWPIATGDKLGDMQSELKPKDFIVEFATEGPKNYTYRLITNEGGKTVCKFRGITQNFHASKLVNFEVI
jgi:hypothetical protein